MACEGQYIMGMGGPIGLSDIAIGHAMDTYFEVKKKDKLKLSLSVRNFARTILSKKAEKESEGKK